MKFNMTEREAVIIMRAKARLAEILVMEASLKSEIRAVAQCQSGEEKRAMDFAEAILRQDDKVREALQNGV